MAEYASHDAAAALARAQELGSTVRKGTKWYVRYQVIYGCAAAFMVLATGLLPTPHGVAIGTGVWVAAIVGLSVFAARQRVARRGFGRWHAVLITVWTALSIAVLLPGSLWYQGAVWWWVPGAVVVALPGLIGGYLEARR
ncbi:hypothetical protein [Streptomyces sp. NPDC058773]|uniref:hypothetical protein n=1 Tax=Streptomyces sp. NPDC058773 TaxID=3346632 RepID=UPI00369E614C